MKDVRTEIKSMLEEVRVSITGALTSEGINASGRTAAGFRVEVRDSHYLLIYDGTGAPLETLELGRKSGKVPMNFTAIIEQWSKDKKLQFPSEKERHKFAGAVAWGKIRNEGFGRPSPSKYGRRSETVYTPALEEAARDLRERLPHVLGDFFRNKIEIGDYGRGDE